MSTKTTAELIDLSRRSDVSPRLRDMAVVELARRNAGNKAVL